VLGLALAEIRFRANMFLSKYSRKLDSKTEKVTSLSPGRGSLAYKLAKLQKNPYVLNREWLIFGGPKLLILLINKPL